MKISKIILFFVLGISSLTFAQTLTHNLHEANNLKPIKNVQNYNPNLIYLDANKIINLPIDGAFLYSSLDLESGIISSGYNNNEDYTLTIRNQYNRRVFLRSHYFSSENKNDVLTIYDGQDTSALEIKSISGYLDENFAIMSSGEYLTLRFKSNNSITSKGFRFRLDNGPGVTGKGGPLPNPMACASTPAADECVNAPLICDLNGYCGNTSGSYTSGNTSGLGNFCGSIENNSWLSFVASGTSASLGFNSGGCQDNSAGIQAVIYASSNCTSFTEVSNCESQGSGSGTFTITTNVNLVPGQTYYVMVDGFAGNICNYTVTAQAGVALGQQITGPNQVCPGGPAVLGASSTASSYNWTSSPAGVYPNTQTITITPTVTTTYTLTMGPSACTPTGITIVKTVTVTNTLNPANITAPSLVCFGSNVSLTSLTNGGTYVWTGPASFTSNIQSPIVNNWTTANNGTYSLTINYGGGCSTLPATVSITGVASPTVNLAVVPSQTICAGQSATITASGGTGTNPYNWNWNPFQTSIVLQSCVTIPFVGTTCTDNPLFSLFPGVSSTGPKAVVTPSVTTQICASFENATGCIGTKCVTITVLPAAAALTISPTATICPGQNTSLTVSGGTTYTWSPAATLSSPNGATVTASPTVTTVYTVSTTVCGGAISTKTVQVVVNGTPPVIGAISGSTLICPSSTGITYSVTNVASTNYTWSVPGGASITSAPTNSNAITVSFGATAGTISVTAVGTCGTATAAITVSISPALSLTVTPNTSAICPGSSVTLTASGATNYTWSPSATLSSANGTSVTASPSTAVTYTILGSTGTCTGSTTASISMSAGLTLTLTSNTPTICPGGAALLDANGATTYTWFPSATLSSANGSNVTASPLVNTTYTVLGSTGTCTGSATVNVGIGVCVSSACDLALIRSTLTAAGNVELLGMNNTCSLYFINPQFMTGPQAQAYAQTFGANLISVQSATENADLVQALSNQGYAAQVIWIGYSDAITEGSYVWYDGAPLSYSNWAPGEPNDAGGVEDCTQIYPDGSWNDLNCSGYNSLSVIEVNICPQVSVVNVPPTHCSFTNVTMNASTLLGSPNYTYTWAQSGAESFTTTSTGTSLNDQITVTSMGPNTFTVFTEDRYSCPQSTTVNLTVFPTPTVTANSATICAGQQTATLTAAGATTYSWIPGTGLSATTGAVVTGTPGATQNYTVIGMDGNGCLNGTVTAITVNSIPSISVSPNVTICPTDATVLTASGTTSYTWSPSSSLSSANGATVTATPTVPTTYTVQGSSANGCLATGTVNVNVSNNGFLPNVYIVQKNSLCDTSILNWLNVTSVTPGLAQGNLPNGITFNATHSGGGLSTTPSMFSGATFPATYSVPIAATTIRNDLAGTFNFCFSQPVINPQIAFASIGQAVLPITITTGVPYQVIWTGINMTYVNSTTLIGAEGFTIIRFPGTHTCISFDYSNNETYINLAFGVMDTQCQGQPICPGDPVELIANGASTYSWNTGAVTTTIAPSPSTTTTYSVVGVTVDGCTNTATTSVIVNPSPTVTVNSASICVGQQTATLTANGAVSYTWNPSATLSSGTGSVVTGTPGATQNYTVTGEDANGCLSNTVTLISVNPLPTVTVNSPSICIGQQTATLTANGASTYSWNPAVNLSSSLGTTVTGTPAATENYTIVGTDANGCFSNTTSTITVNSLPTITATSATICVGQQTATLTAAGATTYSWIPGTGLSATTGAVVTGTPSTTQNYTVAGMDANGCISGTTTAVTVNSLPTVTVNSATICVGQQTATLTANGAITYTWIPGTGLSGTTGAVVTGTPVATQNYTVAGIDANGCINGTVTAITVNPLPVISVSPDMTVCPLSANTLTASGASTYTWSPNIFLNTNTAASVICTPSVTTTYTIDATSALTCTNTAVMTIAVANTVVVNATASTPTICPLASSSLTATGATSYTWSPSLTLSAANGSVVTASPATSTTYTVIGSTSTCTNSAQVVITLTVNPTLTVVPTPSVICSGSLSALTASGASTYTWSPAATLSSSVGATVNANPTTTTIYNISGTSPLGCIGTTSTTLTVVSTPTVSATSAPGVICANSSSTLSAVGATDYTWSPSASVTSPNTSSTNSTPAFTTTYTVIGSNGVSPFLCFDTKTVQVTVIPNPTITPSPAVPICEGQSTLLYANGASTYTWSPTTGVSHIHDSTTNVRPPLPGVYVYTVTGTTNNCSSTATVEITVNALPILDAGLDSTINIDETIALIGTGDTQVGFINASTGVPFDCNYCPTVTVNPQESTCYTLEGISSFGCRNTDVVCITVTKDWDVFIPNAFTPNGDLNNEVFVPMGYGIAKIQLQIFDRWGAQIFKSDENNIGWDGTEKGRVCEQGVYIYKAEITAMSGEKRYKTGHVTLLGKVK